VSSASLALIAAAALALLLCLSALRQRQLDFSTGWKMVTIWVALFALATIVFGWLRM